MTKEKTLISDNVEIPKTAAGFFFYVSKPFKWWAAASLTIVLIAALLAQSSAYLFKLIVDAVEADNYDSAIYYALLYPVVMFIVQVLFRSSGLCAANWTVGSKKYCLDTLSAYMLRHSHSYYSDRFAGSLLSKVNNVTGAVEGLIPELLWTHFNSLVTLLVTIVFIMLTDMSAGMVFVALMLILFIVNARMAPTKTTYSKLTAEANTTFRARFVDVITNILAVRQYSKTDFEATEMNKLSRDLRVKSMRSWFYTEKMLLINSAILFVFSAGMFWLLVESWKNGEMTTGSMVFMMALYSQIAGILVFIGRAFNSTAQSVGEMREGLEDILIPYEITDTNSAKPLVVSKAGIELDKVDFDFGKSAVFSDFNLDIKPGQKVGLVGESGAGKSTFVSLLLRQHDVASGSINIDGQNISSITQDSLRDAIAVVPQEPALFHRSVRENILYSKPGASEEELIAVAKKAQAHDFVAELSEGYDTMVGERGVKLSGGQKQRVAIARAMLKDSPILVLDEATSALDSESEVKIQKALEALMEGRTVIAIAHRLSTLRKMDRIIVMDKGKIIEDGTHEELLRVKGTYYKLWNHQAGGFVQD